MKAKRIFKTLKQTTAILLLSSPALLFAEDNPFTNITNSSSQMLDSLTALAVKGGTYLMGLAPLFLIAYTVFKFFQKRRDMQMANQANPDLQAFIEVGKSTWVWYAIYGGLLTFFSVITKQSPLNIISAVYTKFLNQ